MIENIFTKSRLLQMNANNSTDCLLYLYNLIVSSELLILVRLYYALKKYKFNSSL